MAPWEGTLQWPEWARGNADVAAYMLAQLSAMQRLGVQEIANIAAENTPWDHIREAYVVNQALEGNSVITTIENTDPIFPFVEDDTKPHDIYPRNARVLAFDIGGSTVFAMHVHHPGTHGKHMLESAWESNIDRIAELIAAEMGPIISDWGAGSILSPALSQSIGGL